VPVSTEVLANGEDGRFTLTSTDNIWTSILLDTKQGRLWQCQFSMQEEDRLCIPIYVKTVPVSLRENHTKIRLSLDCSKRNERRRADPGTSA